MIAKVLIFDARAAGVPHSAGDGSVRDLSRDPRAAARILIRRRDGDQANVAITSRTSVGRLHEGRGREGLEPRMVPCPVGTFTLLEKLPDDDRFISDFGATLGEVREQMRRLEEGRALRLGTVGMTVGELEQAELRRQELAKAEANLLRLKGTSQPQTNVDVPPSSAMKTAPSKRSDLPLWAKWTFPLLALAAAVTLGALKLLFP